MNRLNRRICIFCLLSTAAFLLPYLNSWGSFPASYLTVAVGYFAVVLALQAVVLRWLGSRVFAGHIFALGLIVVLTANLFFFTFFASSWTQYELLVYAALYVFILTISIYAKSGVRIASAFLLLQMLMAGVGYFCEIQERPQLEVGRGAQTTTQPVLGGARSVYIVGVDAMVSREAKKVLFGVAKSDAYSWLVANGFDLYDGLSPGDQTLTTYASLLSGTSDVNPRTVRRLFNGAKPSRLYELLNSYGYSRQFFFENDYFGVGPGDIEDFKPMAHSSWTFCKFTDDRWGFYMCRLLNRHVFNEDAKEMNFSERLDFYLKNVRIEPGESWFSIGHIWYPGHTIGAYDAADDEQREAFVRYYREADGNLVKIFSNVVDQIRLRDPHAVIVFMGDHGTNMLRTESADFVLKEHSREDMPGLREMDSRGVLWAVFPKSFCHDSLASLKDSSLLLIELAKCAAWSH